MNSITTKIEGRRISIRTVKRVAAYARVSTDNEEQMSSFAMQTKYYTEYIKGKPGWKLVKIYADNGISGTSIKNRDAFIEMVNDAMNGKIDLIITKSISRFARNTLDSLETIRALKDRGVAVYFEKENINTLEASGELLISIMSSFAQDESRSISANTRMGFNMKMQQGDVAFALSTMRGYKVDKKGKVHIDEEGAKVVHMIYDWYEAGLSFTDICRELKKRGIKTFRGNDNWTSYTICKMLSNEKYTGDALLQKTYVVNYLTHKKVMNNGERPMYYVKNSHPAIISKSQFKRVQKLLKANHRNNTKYEDAPSYPMAEKIICPCCHRHYGVIHKKEKTYTVLSLRCPRRSGEIDHCNSPLINVPKMDKLLALAVNQSYFDFARDGEKIKEIIMHEDKIAEVKMRSGRVKKYALRSLKRV